MSFLPVTCGAPPRRSLSAAVAIAALLAVYIVFLHTPPGPRSLRDFNPDRVAELEVGMWQAYYEKQNVRLFKLLVIMLREQYRYTWAKAATNGFYLARPAARFAGMESGYERSAGSRSARFTRQKTGQPRDYDPPAVPHAELSRWVARRRYRGDGVKTWGNDAAAYAGVLQVPVGARRDSRRLREEAAALRDEGRERAD